MLPEIKTGLSTSQKCYPRKEKKKASLIFNVRVIGNYEYFYFLKSLYICKCKNLLV